MPGQRIAKVIAVTSTRRFFLGSGYLIAPGLLLTAKHVISPDYDTLRFEVQQPAFPADLLAALRNQRFEVQLAGDTPRVAATGIICLDDDAIDTALIIVPGLNPPAGTTARGAVHHGSQPLEGCQITGYPIGGPVTSAPASPIVVRANIAPAFDASGANLEIQVVDPQPRDVSGWAGVSGAAVIGPDGHVLGIVTSAVTRWNSRLRGISIGTIREAARRRHEAELAPLQNLSVKHLSHLSPIFDTENRPSDPPRLRFDNTFKYVDYRYRQVEFIHDGPSGATLDGIVGWAENLRSAPDIQVGVLSGPAGVGKSRIATEACRILTERNWQAGFASYDRLREYSGFNVPHFIVFDYAEQRNEELGQFIDRLWNVLIQEDLGASVRLLLITRSRENWPEQFLTHNADPGQLLTRRFELTTAAFDADHVRQQHARAAYHAFSTTVAGHGQPGELAADQVQRIAEYDRPLLVHVAALLTASGQTLPIAASDGSSPQVLDAFIGLEVNRLAMSARSLAGNRVRARQALCVMTLTAPDLDDFPELLRSARDFGGETESSLMAVARDLQRRYPAAITTSDRSGASPQRLAPIEPDLIASHLLATTQGRRDIVEQLVVSPLVAQRPRYLSRLLHSLALAADDYPQVNDDLQAHLGRSLAQLIIGPDASGSLAELLQQHLERLVTITVELARRQELTAARQLTAALGLPDLPGQEVINELAYNAQFKVTGPNAALDPLGVALGARAVMHATATGDPVTIAVAFSNYGAHLHAIGDSATAINYMRRGMAYFEELVVSGHRERLSSLALGLHNLAAALSGAGEHVEALSTAEQAVLYCKELVAEDRRRNLHFLALAEALYSGELTRADRPGDALAVARRSFDRYEEMLRWSYRAYVAYRPYIEQSAGGLANALAAVGESPDALLYDQYRVFLCEELVAGDRAAFLPELATATNGLATQFFVLGRPADAIPAIDRTVEIYEELVRDEEERYLPTMLRAYEKAIRFRCESGSDLERALRDCRRALPIAEGLEASRPEIAGDLGSRLRLTDTDLCLRFIYTIDQIAARLVELARERLHSEPEWTSPPPVVLAGTDSVPPSVDQVADIVKGMGDGGQVRVAVNNSLLQGRLDELLRFIHENPGVLLFFDSYGETLMDQLRAFPSVASALRVTRRVPNAGKRQLEEFLSDHGRVSRLDPDDPADAGPFALAAGALQMLDGQAVTAGAESAEFRHITHEILRHLYVAGKHHAGIALGWFIRKAWDNVGVDADDPDSLALNDRLAANVFATGDMERALTIWRDVVERRRRTLGPDHRKTFVASSNLATCLNEHGLRDEAQEQYESLLEQGRRVFGAEDPDVLHLHSGYATYLYGLDRYDEALSLYKDLSLRYRRLYSADHPDTLNIADAIALTLHALSRSSEAQVLAESTLARAERVLGVNHPNTRRYAKTLELVSGADAD
jgi:tetratricopeptide (TPR) repeat protein